MRFNVIRKRYAMAIDTRRCVGCSACAIACKEENGLPLQDFRCWVETETRGTYPNLAMEIRSERCEQCTDAPCVANCPTGASFYGDGGIVLVDRDLCTGCKACVAACPYDARYIHPAGYADKCTFCLHRVKKGLQPACVAACPTTSLTFGDVNDPASDIVRLLRERQWKQIDTDAGTKPNLYFVIPSGGTAHGADEAAVTRPSPAFGTLSIASPAVECPSPRLRGEGGRRPDEGRVIRSAAEREESGRRT